MSLFHKNGVLTGQLNSYCLPCDVPLVTDDDVSVHIADPRHKEKLDSTSYVDNYKDDGIRKVPRGYYCECCNKFFVTAFNVSTHVAGGEHRRNKDSSWLRYHGDVVVVLNQLAVDGDSWHGLVEGACSLCNSEYLDKEAHKTIPTHLLKLIQSSVELHASGAIYRKGNDFFHCLICNEVFSLNSFETHFEETEHIHLYNKCCESFKTITSNVDVQDDRDSCNGENKHKDINITDHITNADPKFTDNKLASEKEKMLTEYQQGLRQQRNVDELPSGGATKETLPKKNCENTRIIEKQKTDINGNNLFDATLTAYKVLQLAEEMKQLKEKNSRFNESKIDDGKEKIILSQEIVKNAAVHEQGITEENSNIISSDYSQTQQNSGTLLTEYPQDNGLKIDSVNEMQISDKELINNIEVSERQVNEVDENRSDTTTSESCKFQEKTATTEYHSLRTTESETDAVNEEQIDGREYENHLKSIFQEVEQKNLPKKEMARIIATANKIRYKEGYTKAFCSICVISIPSSLKKIKIHINSRSHRDRAQRIYKCISDVKSQREFFIQIGSVQLTPQSRDVVINETYCVDFWSYSLMTPHHAYVRCHVCEVNINARLFHDHQCSATHNRAFDIVSVVCSLPTEFIREVQAGFYHCGFCNRFEGSWRALLDHCSLPSHEEQKMLARKKLEHILLNQKMTINMSVRLT